MIEARGELVEIWLEHPPRDGESANQNPIAGRIDCPPALWAAPGQYLHAYALSEPETPLGIHLFPGYPPGEGLVVAPSLPQTWSPGTQLMLRGPLGHGFHLPAATRRLALAACGETASRLLPLVGPVLERDGAAALFSDLPLPENLPDALEVYPLDDLSQGLAWADFVVVDLALGDARGIIRDRLRLLSSTCPGQVLLHTEMPCSGMGECGVCAVRTRRGWKLACKDGPVFDLREMDWL